MLNLHPELYIYELDLSVPENNEGKYGRKPLMLFGGVENIPPYRAEKLSQEMSEILWSVRGSMYQAYGIYLRPVVKNRNSISTRVSPLEASIDEKCKDRYVQKGKLADTISRMVFIQGKDTDLVYFANGFYLVHLLRKEFNTQIIDNLLKRLKAAMLKLVYERFRISSIILDDLLQVDAEIIPPYTSYIV